MVDAGIGRLLVASLHQGIADVSPLRLEFYEHWLTPLGLREGRMGLAPLQAVLSFLRQEGRTVYDDVMAQAGRHAAEWAHAELGVGARALTSMLPARLRARYALGLCRRLVQATFHPSVARVRLAGSEGSLTISGSVFCGLREAADWPMCRFYAAAVEHHLTLTHVPAVVTVARCRAEGGHECLLHVQIGGSRPATTAEAA
jgi:hypothetical protein